jgi:hypothetical protein
MPAYFHQGFRAFVGLLGYVPFEKHEKLFFLHLIHHF